MLCECSERVRARLRARKAWIFLSAWKGKRCHSLGTNVIQNTALSTNSAEPPFALIGPLADQLSLLPRDDLWRAIM